MLVTVRRDLVAGGRHLRSHAPVYLGVDTEHEERGRQPQAVELLEEQRRRCRVRAVVEGEGHVIGPAQPGQPRQIATPEAGACSHQGHGVGGEGGGRTCDHDRAGPHQIWVSGAAESPVAARFCCTS